MDEFNLENEFLKLINLNSGIVHKVSRAYCKDPIDRQDLFQEIIFQLWKSYPTFNGQSKFSTWMYQVALNTAITYFRKGKRNLAKGVLEDYHLNVGVLQEQTIAGDRIEALYTAINTLSAVDKMIILLYLDDKSYEEIALITGLTKSNISVRLVRIKKLLKTKLQNKV
ncbi:MAG: sigma-70 family RNA polymerase sigma factor [Chitinophagaceae bacterium]|nr:sigma-70 family RNA polymerase sigma factor [Chitinophagaceae bacterium]